MKPAPLIVDIDPFDLEGFLFITFPVEAWLNGQARKALEDEIRANGDERIDHATILTALGSMQSRALAGLKPWEVEALRIEWHPESVARFPPYWVQNGGTHTPDELNRSACGCPPNREAVSRRVWPDWEFGNDDGDTWSFGEDEPKTRTPLADGWDFGADDATTSWDF